VQVVGRKVVVLENDKSLTGEPILPSRTANQHLARCWFVVRKEVDQESRDVIWLSTREVLRVPEVLVLVCAMRGGWAALRDKISAAGVTVAELADTRSLNHLESEVV